MPAPTLTPYGERGLLLQVEDGPGAATEVAGWVAAFAADPVPGVVDVVPAARSVLLHLGPEVTPAQVRSTVALRQPLLVDDLDPVDPVDIPVVYDGPDLAEVAALCGLRPAAVVQAHQLSSWVVAFAGFAPGFAYLSGGDPALAVPRRDTPRARVPAGAVALAAGYSAVYPRPSPGGWQLIGHTTLTLWDVDRDPPALLRPGRRVRFVEAAG